MIVGIGIDLVEIERVESVLAKHGGRFAQKIFTEVEQAYCDRMPRPALHYAARFAAKEAFVKAIGTGIAHGVRWRDIGIENLPSGQPLLRLEGRALEEMQARGGRIALVTLAHTRGHACASVVVEGEAPKPG